MSRTQRIAEILNTSDATARIFCAMVQKDCKPAPTYKTILYALQHLSAEERSVHDVIQYIQKNMPDSQVSSKTSKQKTSIGYIPTKSKGGFDDWDEDNFAPPVMGHDPRDHITNFEKCPHGIPKIRICAICNPEKFRDFMDID